MKAGDLVELNDIAASYALATPVGQGKPLYGVLLDRRDYIFEEDPPLENKTEVVWRVLVKKEVHDILEKDLMWKGSTQKK
jgi:hypothetical protein